MVNENNGLLIDKYMDRHHFHEIHTIVVEKPPAIVYPVIKKADFRKSKIINLLFSLRGLPDAMAALEGFLDVGFLLLEERDNDEFVVGLIGKPWQRRVVPLQVASDHFSAFDEDGYIKAVMNFKVIGLAKTRTVVFTETRIYCTDSKAKRLFSLYWAIISRFSGVVRTSMLNLIKREAENSNIV